MKTVSSFKYLHSLPSEHDDEYYKSKEDPDFVTPDNTDKVSDAPSSAND